MKTNKAMQRLIDSLNPTLNRQDIGLFNPRFIEWDNCILINTDLLEDSRSITDTIYHDRTELEASINHFHIEDINTGLELIKNWEGRLREQYSDKAFIIILSCSIEGEDVVIRFYQVRDSEPGWIEPNNLEAYKEEAILIHEVLNESR